MPERESNDLSHREVVEHLARRAHRIMGALADVRLAPPGRPDPVPPASWEALAPHDREDARQLVYSCLREPEGDYAAVWADRVGKLEDEGWSRGLVQDQENKQSPLVRPFGELPLPDRQALAVFITAVRSMYE